MTTSLDRELGELLELGDRIVRMARDRGGADRSRSACFARAPSSRRRCAWASPSSSKRRARARPGMRVIKAKRVASTSTSDLTEAGIERFVADAHRARRACRRKTPFAGPADPAAPVRPVEGARPRALRSRRRCGRRGARHRAREAKARPRRARSTRASPTARARRSGARRAASAIVLSSGFRAGYKGSYASLNVVPVAADEGGKNRRGYHWTARASSPSSIPPPRSGARPRAARSASSARSTVVDVRGPRRLRSRRRALHPRHARRLRDGQRDLAQVELPASAARARASRAISSPSSTTRSCRARPARARSTARGSRAARTSSSRREYSARTSATATPRASSAAQSTGERVARRRRRRRRPARRTSSFSRGPTRTRPS